MEPLSLIYLCLAGIVAGFLNVLAGGGSLLVLPLMVFLGMDGAVANGTNRVAILIQNVSAVSAFRRKGYSDWKGSLALALWVIPGAAAGALLGVTLSGGLFNKVLAGVMVLVLVLMNLPKTPADAPRISPFVTRLAMLGVGFYVGFIQAGVGFILMAILYRTTHQTLVRVNMHKVFIILIATATTLPIFAMKGKVIWSVGLVLAMGNALGAWIGSHVQIKKGETLILWTLRLTIVAMAIKLLLRA